MINLDQYDKHPLHCPYCGKDLYSHKGFRFSEHTNYDCLDCGYVFTGWCMTSGYKNMVTKEKFYSVKKEDHWIFEKDKRK